MHRAIYLAFIRLITRQLHGSKWLYWYHILPCFELQFNDSTNSSVFVSCVLCVTQGSVLFLVLS